MAEDWDPCPKCGTKAKSAAGQGAHDRNCKVRDAVLETPEPSPNPPSQEPAPQTDELIVLDWQRTGISELDHNKREVKMVAAQCAPCQEKNLPRWWEKCPHNPYFSQTPRPISVPVLACSKCGVEVEANTVSHCGQTNFELRGTKDSIQYENAPNTRAVMLEMSANMGRLVERQRTERGWKMPEDLGIAPMCQHSRCWEPLQDKNGKWRRGVVRVTWGDYCGELHAKLVALDQGPEAVEVYNQRIRREQLSKISL